MHFKSLEDFANHLAHAAVKKHKDGIKRILGDVGSATAKRARKKIGTLQPAVGQYPAWQPLKDATVLRKARYGLGKSGDPESPLYATGAFSKSIRYKTDPNRGLVHVGTNLEYIIHTELGTSTQPPRPVFSPSALEVVPDFLPVLAENASASLIGASGFYEYTSPQKDGAKGTLI